MRSLYYYPADYGLTELGHLDTGHPYEFNLLVVWRDREGRLWAGHDAGCSCPTPFESTSLLDLTRVTSVEQFRELVWEVYRESSCFPHVQDVANLARKVQRALSP